MVDPFQTLRFRLTSQYVIIFGLLQVLLWVTVYLVVDSYLRARFDSELLRRAQTVMTAVQSGLGNSSDSTTKDQIRQAIDAFNSEQFFFIVDYAGDESDVRSSNALGMSFPESALNSGENHSSFTTVDDPQTAAWSNGEPIRFVSLLCDRADKHGMHVQVGASLGPVEKVVEDIQRLLVVFVALSLMLAGISSWIVAGRSLRPVNVIAREAKNISSATLNRRISIPANRDEVTEMVESLNGMLGRLERQFKNEHEFISNASHELKTPLAVMLGHVQNQLRQSSTTAEVRDFLESTEEELWRLRRIVESCLVLARTHNADKLQFSSRVNLEDVLVESLKQSARETVKRSIQIIPRIDECGSDGIEPIVVGDSELLRTMFNNLVHNAIHYSPDGGAIEIDVKCANHEVAISVKDRGPSIPKEHHERVFEFSFRLDPEDRASGTSGIGLSIVKAIAEVHGGGVYLSNREGGGCEFTVRLPPADHLR
ncbi:MAG TPA: ATP-binding protein [Phycisphaerae bacterium]|nr:ATP-binding protein [Phycisphaerae bacterium]